MSWAVIAVGVIGAGASVAGSAMSSSGGGGSISGEDARKAYGSVPEPAEYQPVDFTKVQIQNILSQGRHLLPMNNLLRENNIETTKQALQRARQTIPGYKDMMRTYGAAGSDLLHMRLPFDDVLGIISDRNELAGTMGIPGTAGPATLKDLGLSRVSALQAGGGILKDMVGMAETINPISRHDIPANWMIHPLDRIKLTMDQNQLIQQSTQNKNNLEAAGDPAARAQLELGLAQSGQSGSAAGSALSGVGSILGSVGGGMFSGGGGSLGSSGSITAGTPYAVPSGYINSSASPGPQPGTFYM